MLMDGLATEGIVLQIKEPGSSLNIGHAIRRRALQTGKYLAASQCPLELADELVKVMLSHAVQVDELSVDVVEYLYFSRRWAHKEQRRATGKQLNITRMLGEHGQQVFCQSAFTAHPRDNR